jgi:hypothetical protein
MRAGYQFLARCAMPWVWSMSAHAACIINSCCDAQNGFDVAAAKGVEN